MDDLHSINDAINRRAGRKLGPSILVSLSLVAIVWASLAFIPIFFAALVTLAVCLGIREISRAFAQVETKISSNALILATIGLSAATWQGGVAGLAFSIEQVLNFQRQHFSKVPLHNIQGYDYSCKSQQTEW